MKSGTVEYVLRDLKLIAVDLDAVKRLQKKEEKRGGEEINKGGAEVINRGFNQNEMIREFARFKYLKSYELICFEETIASLHLIFSSNDLVENLLKHLSFTSDREDLASELSFIAMSLEEPQSSCFEGMGETHTLVESVRRKIMEVHSRALRMQREVILFGGDAIDKKWKLTSILQTQMSSLQLFTIEEEYLLTRTATTRM